MDGILVADRGEVAIRVLRAADALGIRTVAVYSTDDADSSHVRRADAALALPGEGAAAYADGERMLAVARDAGVTTLHPGHGPLAGSAEFARRCAAEGITFVGPPPELLALVGDAVLARQLAARLDVPVLPGTDDPTGPDEVRAFVAARRIDVQIAGDGTDVGHLWEREGVRYHLRTLVEVAPSPAVDPALRRRLLDAAVRIAADVHYTGLGTVGFLVSGDRYWFVEIDPRLGAGHTVTEEITGIDLVRTQLRLAGGACLADVGLAARPAVSGCAVQAGVRLETIRADDSLTVHTGTLRAFTAPSGPGVRVDTHGHTGYRTNPRYDSLLAKVTARGQDLTAAAALARSALGEFQVDGLPTNIPLLLRLLGHPLFTAGRATVTFVADHIAELADPPVTDADTARDGWADEVDQLRHRAELARRMGGERKVARQHAEGRLTARERIDALADPGSFREIGGGTGFAEYDDNGDLTGLLPANFVTGTARIDGRRVVLGVDDFTVRGGSGDAAIHAKQVFSEQYAGELRIPLVRLLDGASGGGSVKMAQEAGFTYIPVNPGWDAVVDNLSLIPVVAACLGPTVGLGAARLVMSHLAVMVAGVGQLFTAGPPVVRGAIGEDLTKEQLGGASVHRRNGSVERIVATEREAFDVIRRFLSYLPHSVFDTPPVTGTGDPPERREESLLAVIPRNPRLPYRIEPILAAIFDAGSVLRYADYGGATVTALARLDGHPVGVIATDPYRGATMSAVGAQAITRLVDLCETFHLPVVSLTDQAGMTIGLAAERNATIRHGARAITAVYQARTPQAELILRRVYGVGGAGIVNRHRPGRGWAWPSGDWGSLPVQGGIEAAFRAQLEQVEDRAAEIERIRARLAEITSPFRTAEHFGVQDLIDPRDSRALLCEWVRDAYRVLPEQVGRPSFGTRP
jgi:acetyl-CoA carboxylase carboxyltransferase component/biotin carboxylase